MILKFPSSSAREDFLHRMKSASVGPIDLRPMFAQPTVVVVSGRDGISEQGLRSELSPFLSADVKVFDDVKFQAM
ncbi:hypothetical protein [Bradyrhizobium sp. HKCCYLS20291]|uniref:hypothetical protein n=1 Tax=Bradyrhizobium sp. HKCCYLS20291 TaxID=3420766 RepID=UPI003EC06F28